MGKALKTKEIVSKNKDLCKYILKLTYTTSSITEMAKCLSECTDSNIRVEPTIKYFDVYVPKNKTDMIDRSFGKNLPVVVKRTINDIINTLNSQYKETYGENCYIDKILKTEIMAYDNNATLDMYRGRIFS